MKNHEDGRDEEGPKRTTVGSNDRVTLIKWSGRRDSNPRPSAPKADALPGCATPRHLNRFYKYSLRVSSCEVRLALREKPRQVCLKSRIHCGHGWSRLYQVALASKRVRRQPGTSCCEPGGRYMRMANSACSSHATNRTGTARIAQTARAIPARKNQSPQWRRCGCSRWRVSSA
jgi:hypothetical protein